MKKRKKKRKKSTAPAISLFQNLYRFSLPNSSQYGMFRVIQLLRVATISRGNSVLCFVTSIDFYAAIFICIIRFDHHKIMCDNILILVGPFCECVTRVTLCV